MGDRLTDLYAAVGALKPKPWLSGGRYQHDARLLQRLLQVLVDNGKIDNAQTGGPSPAVDVWVASELRRAGLSADAVWPRPEEPRVLPQSLARALSRFKPSRTTATAEIQKATIAKLLGGAGGGRSIVIGGQFPKEVDVVVAEWDRGLDLAVSTKAMTSSYGKNVSNRWEEASGDLLNIRRRFPLASFGFVFLATTGVLQETTSFERVKDMLRKLTTVVVGGAEGSAYDAACLILVDWARRKVVLNEKSVPEDLAPPQFFEQILRALFERAPVTDHGAARKLWLASNPPDAPV